MTGEYPVATIDHRDYNPGNNKWDNLRDVSQQQNNRNIQAPRKHNATQVQGVTRFRGKYRARITVDGKNIHLGLFATTAEGEVAYAAAKDLYHKEKVA